MKLTGITMHIDATPEEVFDFMADVGHEKDWNPDVKSVQRVGDGPVGAGAEWDGDYRGMGAMHVRLEEYERPTRLAFSTIGPRMDMRFAFHYRPSPDGGSSVDVGADIRPKGFTKLMAPLLGPMMRRTFGRRPAQIAAGLRAEQARRQ